MKIIKSLEGRFEEAVIAYLFVVNILPIVIIPLMWFESRKIARVLDNWTDFEVSFFRIINEVFCCIIGKLDWAMGQL